MIAARRVYLYLVAFIALWTTAWGATDLARTLIDALFPGSGTTAAAVRREVAWAGAALIVGVPIWLLHWSLAVRAARRDEEERRATLRRLYLYAVMAVATAAAASALQDVLEEALRAVLDGTRAGTGREITEQLPWLLIGAALWLYHRRTAHSDRRAAGEEGGGATLRRWYVYGVAFVSLMYLLRNAARVLRLVWETAAGAATGETTSGSPPGLEGAAATTLVALLVWAVHWTLLVVKDRGPRTKEEGDLSVLPVLLRQDSASILRPVYLFGALAVSVGVTLAALWQLLYYALARVFGVSSPGGVGGSLVIAMAGPVSSALLYGTSWLYQRRALASQAAAQGELPRQAGVRRLYVYVVALLALGVLAGGAGGLLWTLADVATATPRSTPGGDWWQEQVSLYVSLVVVGLPVWARHWGPVAAATDAGEARSLARRIYLYVALGAGVLALLGAGVAGVREILQLALGEAATGSVMTDLARALSVAAVAALVVFYHQRVLRRDLAVTQQTVTQQTQAAQAATVIAPFSPAMPPSPDRPFGVVYRLASGVEGSEWFASADAASHAANGRRADGAAPEWVVTVRVEA